MSEPGTPENPGDLFLKRVLARLDANREASKLANDMAHVCAFEADRLEDAKVNKSCTGEQTDDI